MAISIPATSQGRAVRRQQRAPQSRAPETNRERAFDRGYWIAHCGGYRVDGSEGRIGFVEEVRGAAGDPQGLILAVRAGLLGRRFLLIPAENVLFIVPLSERIWLKTPVTLIGSEPAATRPPTSFAA